MIDSHDKLVARISRILWQMGFFCRTNVPIDLVRWVPEEAKARNRISIADIDVLALKYDPDLARRVTIAEAKTGDLKPVDRILWLRGLMDYFKASDAYLVPLKEEEAFGEVSRALAIHLINAKKLAEFEKSFAVELGLPGPYDSELIDKRREFYSELKKTKAKGPLYFVTFRAWEENPPHLSLKLAIGQGKDLAQYLNSRLSVSNSEKWLAYELLEVFSISLLNYAGLLRGFSYSEPEEFEGEIKRTISHGRLNPREMNQMIDLFYDLMATYVKTEFGKTLSVKKEDLFDIVPKYASDVADVIFRILNSPTESKEVLRALDVIASASIRGVPLDAQYLQKLIPGVNLPKLLKLSENNAKLFCSATGLSPALYSELGTTIE